VKVGRSRQQDGQSVSGKTQGVSQHRGHNPDRAADLLCTSGANQKRNEQYGGQAGRTGRNDGRGYRLEPAKSRPERR
jgi:hypothetical protein